MDNELLEEMKFIRNKIEMAFDLANHGPYPVGTNEIAHSVYKDIKEHSELTKQALVHLLVLARYFYADIGKRLQTQQEN